MQKENLLFIDEALLAVNKPAGLRTIPDGYNPSLPHLSQLLQEQFGRVWVVHRLDKDTSGVILFARSAEVHRSLNTQFEQRLTRKEYHALVIGEPEWKEATINLPLRVNGDRQHRTVIDHQHGKPAETEVRVLGHSLGIALLSALPHTGYTHQIRAHLAGIDFPILADPLYKSLKPETQATRLARQAAAGFPLQRCALHAFQLSFQHPLTGQQITIEAPYPDDFRETVELLLGK